MIRAEFRILRARRLSTKRWRCWRDGDAKAAGRRHEPDSDDEAAAGRAGASGGHGPHEGSELHSRGGGTLHIGATTTHYRGGELRRWCARKCPLLAETAANIGDVQVRNMGTIGGSVAHADPAADYPAALQALEAKVRLERERRARRWRSRDFFVDTFTTALEPGEIVREVIVPVEDASARDQLPEDGAAGLRIRDRGRRGARAESRAGKITMARVGVTGLAAKAYRAPTWKRRWKAPTGSAADIQKAAALVADGVDANSDLHASADYRKHLAGVYTTRALTAALSRTA